MPQSDQHSKVSVEDLLRLKRAERPTPEFWSNFEKELRQKQLTALVQKRRWWDGVPVLLPRRFYMPAGAAAIVAFTLVTVRYAAPSRIAQASSTAPQIVQADPTIEVLAATEVTEPASAQAVTREETVAVAVDPNSRLAQASDVTAAAPVRTLSVPSETSPSRSLVSDLTRLAQSEPDLLAPLLGDRLSAPPRIQPVAVAQSDVASMAPVSNGNRYQLIARYADRALSPAPAAPAVVRDRLARRLGDDLGDSISRIGVVGNRVSLKF